MIMFLPYHRTPKGAIVAINPPKSVASATVSRYNPESLTWLLDSQFVSEEGIRSEVFRLKGAPKKSISAEIVNYAADQFEKASRTRNGTTSISSLLPFETFISVPVRMVHLLRVTHGECAKIENPLPRWKSEIGSHE